MFKINIFKAGTFTITCLVKYKRRFKLFLDSNKLIREMETKKKKSSIIYFKYFTYLFGEIFFFGAIYICASPLPDAK